MDSLRYNLSFKDLIFLISYKYNKNDVTWQQIIN